MRVNTSTMEDYTPMAKRQRTAKTNAITKCRKQLGKSQTIADLRKRKGLPDESVGRVGVEEYLVENILDVKIGDGTREYLVKWLGWNSSFNSWEPEENMTGCQDLIKDYWEKNKVSEKAVPVQISTAIKGTPGKQQEVEPSPDSVQSNIAVSKVNTTQMYHTGNKIPDKLIKPTDDETLRPDTEPNGNSAPNVSPPEPKNEKPSNVLIQQTGFGLQRQIRIFQKNTIFPVNPDILIKSAADSKFDFVVTTLIENRTVQKIYDRVMESAGVNYVLCEFEGCNLIEVVPQRCFKFMRKNTTS